MITIQIENQIIEIPEELTIDQFQKIQKNPIKYNKVEELLSLYLGIPTEVIKDCPWEEIDFIEKYITAQLMKKTDPILKPIITIGDIQYGLENDFGNLKWGQWTDMEVYSQQDNLYDSLHIIMALLYRPVKKIKGNEYELEPYSSKTVMARAELMRNLPASYWLGTANFFFLISKLFITNINSSLSLRNKWMKWMKPVLKILPVWLHPRLPQDFILNLPSNFQERT